MKIIIALVLLITVAKADLFASQADAFTAMEYCENAGVKGFKAGTPLGDDGGDESAPAEGGNNNNEQQGNEGENNGQQRNEGSEGEGEGEHRREGEGEGEHRREGEGEHRREGEGEGEHRREGEGEGEHRRRRLSAETAGAETTEGVKENEEGGCDGDCKPWTDAQCGAAVDKKFSHYCTGNRGAGDTKHGNGRCTWNRGGDVNALALSITVFAGWMLILFGLVVECNCCCEGWWHRIFCCCLHFVEDGPKELELQRKYLDNEPNVVEGDKLWSFWNIYKSTDPFLATFLCEKSHFSNRFTKAITVLFIMTYGLFIEFILTIGKLGFVVKLFVVMIPNALFWNPLMDKYSMKVAIAKVKGKSGDSWLVWMNRAKNAFVFMVSLVFFTILMFLMHGGGMPLPNSYIGGYFLNAVLFPIVINALKQFLIFSMAWGMVKHGQTEETAPWWKYKILSWTGCLPGTVSGNITQATPAVDDEKRNPGAGGGKKIEIVEHSADKSHSGLTE